MISDYYRRPIIVDLERNVLSSRNVLASNNDNQIFQYFNNGHKAIQIANRVGDIIPLIDENYEIDEKKFIKETQNGSIYSGQWKDTIIDPEYMKCFQKKLSKLLN